MQETLPRNIANNADYPNTQFVVVDYDSRDGLEVWMKEHYSHEIESGLIKYVKLAHPSDFRMPHAKNLAHRMGDGDILVNLDADNVTAEGFASWVQKQFARDENIFIAPKPMISAVHKLTNGETTGVNGRIVVSRKHFEHVHGYDETKNFTRNEDVDFCGRLAAIGVRRYHLPLMQYGSVIQHDDAERTKHLGEGHREAVTATLEEWGNHRLVGAMRWALKGHKPEQRPSDGVNPGGKVGCAEVYVNFSDKPITIPPLEVRALEPAGHGR